MLLGGLDPLGARATKCPDPAGRPPPYPHEQQHEQQRWPEIQKNCGQHRGAGGGRFRVHHHSLLTQQRHQRVVVVNAGSSVENRVVGLELLFGYLTAFRNVP